MVPIFGPRIVDLTFVRQFLLSKNASTIDPELSRMIFDSNFCFQGCCSKFGAQEMEPNILTSIFGPAIVCVPIFGPAFWQFLTEMRIQNQSRNQSRNQADRLSVQIVILAFCQLRPCTGTRRGVGHVVTNVRR